MIWQNETGRGTEETAFAVALSPIAENLSQFPTSISTASSFWCHNNDVSVRGALDLQIAIDLTELEELLIVHMKRWAGMDDHSLGLKQ